MFCSFSYLIFIGCPGAEHCRKIVSLFTIFHQCGGTLTNAPSVRNGGCNRVVHSRRNLNWNPKWNCVGRVWQGYAFFSHILKSSFDHTTQIQFCGWRSFKNVVCCQLVVLNDTAACFVTLWGWYWYNFHPLFPLLLVEIHKQFCQCVNPFNLKTVESGQNSARSLSYSDPQSWDFWPNSWEIQSGLWTLFTPFPVKRE